MPESLVFIDADGTTHDLRCGGAPVDGIAGRFAPPIEINELVPAAQPGTVLDSVRHDARDVDVPVAVDGATAALARAALRTLVAGLDPIRGDGTLRATDVSGTVRNLTCRYVGGLEVQESLTGRRRGINGAGDNTDHVQLAVLTFRAFDPYWKANTQTTQTFTTGEAATFFPFFPLSLSSSEVFASTTVNNTGDVEAWPIWTITGPGSGIVVRNLTTGEDLDLGALSLGDGETLTIDTRPGIKTVTRDNGDNEFANLTADSSLWSLRRGTNSVQIEMTGATGDSQVDLAYTRRFLTP